MQTLINSKQTREILNISETKFYELVHDPKFYPALRIGRKILIDREQLSRWMEEQRIGKGERS
jgi:excisionase family DNA binding protein